MENSFTEEEESKTMNLRCSGSSIDNNAIALKRSKIGIRTFTQAPERYGKAKKSEFQHLAPARKAPVCYVRRTEKKLLLQELAKT